MSQSEPDLAEVVAALRDVIGNNLKKSFVGKDQVVDLMTVCAIAHEHLLLVGPPGTAKSELIKRFVLLLGADSESGDLFEYLLTRFTEPNEIFGPVDIKKYQDGTFTRNIERALPVARVAFLDEVFKANSAILNALLTILNERFYFNGLKQVNVPLISVYGATNEVPESDELDALFDRFILRVRTENVDDRLFRTLVTSGWEMERERILLGRNQRIAPVLPSLETLRVAYKALPDVDLTPVLDVYRELVRQIRNEGISLSDRRAVKLQKLIAAAAVMRQERQASAADLWVLLHVWNRPEQIPALQAIVGPIVEEAGGLAVSAERSLSDIADRLGALKQRLATNGAVQSYSPMYYDALLHDLETVRQELFNHSSGAGQDGQAARWRELSDEIESLIDDTLDRLEADERV